MSPLLRRSLSARTLAILSLTASLGCGMDGPGDGRDDSFGGANAKSDSEYTQCQLSEVLNFVNESNTTIDRLLRHGLTSDPAKAIFAHRIGPDGQLGTGDDDIYDDLDELDAVDFVGPVALDHLVAAILTRCEVDLETRPFITEETFAGFTGGGFERDSVELEAALTVTGISGQLLHEILHTESGGRNNFARIAKPRIMEAFSYSYSIDEMPWDSDSHAAREGLPYLPLSIESGRYAVDPASGERELSLGTDIMDDIYFDTFDYRLTRSEMILRGRVRWDGPEVIRRLLIAAKFSPFVDENGLKRAAKLDVRTEGGTHAPTIEQDVMTGTVPWSSFGSSSRAPLEPVKEIYTELNGQNRLPDIGQHRDVLVLDPKVHLRSDRKRYHLDLAQQTAMRNFYANGRQRIRDIKATAETALSTLSLTSAQQTAIQQIIDMADRIDDGSLIADRARTRLLAIDPSMNVTVSNLSFPDELASTAATLDDLEKNQVVAETVNEVFHELGELVDAQDRILTATTGLDFDEYVPMYVLYRKSIDTQFSAHRTTHQFLARWREIAANGASAVQQEIDDFNAFGAAQLAAEAEAFEDFEPLTQESWDALGKHLHFETNKTNQRQVEAAGTMALGLWFEQARETYVPSSNRPFGNFMIDTMDMSEMVTREEWLGIDPADRGIDIPLDPAKVFHTALVNEVQIELGNEAPYIDRVEELQALIDAGSATEDDLRTKEGALFVLKTMSDALIYLSEVKADKILDRLDDGGAPNGIRWEPSKSSKGTLALELLGDMM